jgi:hypothetical protein
MLFALGACTSTQDVLDPANLAPPQSTAGQPDAATALAPSPGTTASTTSAPVPAGTRIRFAPIVGPSVEAATALSESLSAGARQRGIAMAGAADTSSYLLRGYFTPLVEGRETTVVFVWDVYDTAGNRVHRISGQERAPAGSGDGWTAVPAASMQAIGGSTIDQFAAWVASRG